MHVPKSVGPLRVISLLLLIAMLLAACGTPAGSDEAAADTPAASQAASQAAVASAAPSTAPSPSAAPSVAAGASAAASEQAGAAESPLAGASAAAGGGEVQIVKSSVPGVPDAILGGELEPFQSVQGTPGNGGTVSSFQITYTPPIPAPAENRYLQELNKRLGVTFEPTVVPAAAYAERLAAITAGGDLPDLVLIDLNTAPDQLRAIQQGAYCDLTPYLTGDALKEYPNLAAFPERLWENVKVQDKIYGVPRPRYLTGNSVIWRQDWAENLGMAEIENADDFREVAVAFSKNDPDGNGHNDTFGLGSNNGDLTLPFIYYMFRVPNQWQLNDDGSLTYYIETDAFKQAIEYARQLYADGAYHPDAANLTTAQSNEEFKAGKLGGYINAFYSLVGIERDEVRKNFPDAELTVLIPPGHDGGQGVVWNNSGYFGFVAISARNCNDEERVKELLRILNYFAAPAGSTERTFLDNGIEGVHHEVGDGGRRQLTELGKLERGDVQTIMGPPPVFRRPEGPEQSLRLQKIAEELTKIGIDNPALTAFSETQVAQGAELNQLVKDRITAIVLGREPLEAVDTLVQEWRSRGGDQIRQEFEADLKASGS